MEGVTDGCADPGESCGLVALPARSAPYRGRRLYCDRVVSNSFSPVRRQIGRMLITAASGRLTRRQEVDG